MPGLSPGAVVLASHGLSLADGLPIALSESIFPIVRLPEMGRAAAKRCRGLHPRRHAADCRGGKRDATAAPADP